MFQRIVKIVTYFAVSEQSNIPNDYFITNEPNSHERNCANYI